MAYIKTTWKNKIVERPKTFRQQPNADGTVTLIPAEGNIIEPGTPVDAQNMNKIENAIEKGEIDMFALDQVIQQLKDRIKNQNDLVDFHNKKVSKDSLSIVEQIYAYPDTKGNYFYLTQGGSGLGIKIAKYDADTFELIATSNDIPDNPSGSQGLLVQDDDFVYVDLGGYIAKYSKSDLRYTKVSKKDYGATGSMAYRDGFIYATSYGTVYKIETSELKAVTSFYIDTDRNKVKLSLSPQDKLFCIAANAAYELDTSTLQKIRSFPRLPKDFPQELVASKDNVLFTSTGGGIYNYKQSTGQLYESKGLLGDKSYQLIGADGEYAYIQPSSTSNSISDNNTIYKVDIDSLIPVKTAILASRPMFINIGERASYYSFNKIILRSK